MSRSETIPQPKRREQPHIIADRVSRRVGANRIRAALGLPPLPVTTKPEYPAPRPPHTGRRGKVSASANSVLRAEGLPLVHTSIWEMTEDDRRVAIARRAAAAARRALGRRDYMKIEPTPAPAYPKPVLVIPDNAPQWRRILFEVAMAHGIPVVLILGKQRQRPIMAARHELMFRMSRETGLTIADIGRRLKRDHTTVLSGIRAHQRRQAASQHSPLSPMFTGTGHGALTQDALGQDASS